MLQTFWDIYSISPPIYTCFTLKFFYNIFIEDAIPEKALKYDHFQKNLDQNLHF